MKVSARKKRSSSVEADTAAPSVSTVDAEYQVAGRIALGFAVVALIALGVFFLQADDIGERLRAHPTPVMAESNDAVAPNVSSEVVGSGDAADAAEPGATDVTDELGAETSDGVDPSTLAEQVDEMTADEVVELAATLERVIRDNPDRFERSATDVGAIEKGAFSLADAYAEAERRFPGDVNAAKRLKLVSDLGSGAYWYYVAERGDTLIALSRSFGVSLGQLVELNGIRDADKLPAGMVILLPDGVTVPETVTVEK